MFQQESLNPLGSFFVRTNVTIVVVPPFQDVSRAAFMSYDTNSNHCRMMIVRTIESNRRDWITAKAFLGPFDQTVLGS